MEKDKETNDSNAMSDSNIFVSDSDREHLGGNLLFGDPGSFSPKVLDYVMDRFCIRSVLDVGAGRGQLAHYLHKKCSVPVIAIEGLPYNVETAVYPLVQHDLANDAFICPCDLVVSVELVEHIEEKHIETLMKTLTNGQYVLMTHALPNQGGQFHVNEQTSEYWIDLFQKAGYGLLITESALIRRLAQKEEHCATYFSQSGLLFAKLPK